MGTNEIDILVGYSDTDVVFRIFSVANGAGRDIKKEGTADTNKVKRICVFDVERKDGAWVPYPSLELATVPGAPLVADLVNGNKQIKVQASTYAFITPASQRAFSEAKLNFGLALKGVASNNQFEPIVQLQGMVVSFAEHRNGFAPEFVAQGSDDLRILLADLHKVQYTFTPNISGESPGQYGFEPHALHLALRLSTAKRERQGTHKQMRFVVRFEKVKTKRSLLLTFDMELQMVDDKVFLEPLDLEALKTACDFRRFQNSKLYYIRVVQQQPAEEPAYDEKLGARFNLTVQFPHSDSLFAWWNRHIKQPVQDAQLLVNAGRSASFLPHLEFIAPHAEEVLTWDLVYAVFDKTTRPANAFAKPAPKPAEIEVAGTPATNDRPVKLFLQQVTPTAATDAQAELPAHGFINTKISFTGLKTVHQSTSLPATHSIFAQLQPGNLLPEKNTRDIQSAQVNFRLGEHRPGTTPQIKVRLQGLTLLLPAAAPVTNWPQLPQPDGSVEASLQLSANLPVTRRATSFKLSVYGFEAGKQDDNPGEEFEEGTQEGGLDIERPSTIIIPLRHDTINQQRTYQLEVNEKQTTLVSHSIKLQLNETRNQQPGAIETDMFLIDPEPLFIARVRAIDLGEDRLAALTNEIGNWSIRPEGSFTWNVSISGDSFSILLPPQAIAESMHRYREAEDITPGQPADMRFGPPASIDVYSNELGQRFSQLPWNLRRRLGIPGEAFPGAPVKKMSVELVYGINSEITTPSLRITEVQARLGHLQPYLPPQITAATPEGKKQYERHALKWNSLLDVIRNRIAVLEPYRTGAPATTGNLFITEEGLTVYLRPDADLAYPFNTPPPAGVNLPIGGLKGSFAWAFESANVYHALWRDTKAVNSRLSGLLLSSFGGSGHLTATFDRGLTTIDAVVSMGRIDRIKIERKGRISTVWNRAKHVIVYDRTVAATRQFFLDQYAYIGNAILRKTEEYVEIEQRERPFKDNDLAALESKVQFNQQSGFVESCVFAGDEHPRIRVSSKWGEDVEGGTGKDTWKGWKVPLWKVGAAPADVYPRPDVRLMMATEVPATPDAAVIEDPQKLYFFTLTEAGQVPDLGDIESWLPIPGIDSGAVVQQLQEAATTGDDKKDHNAATVPGLGNFTFTISTPGLVNMVADRQANNIVARLSAITLLRGPLDIAAGAQDQLYTSTRAALDRVNNAIDPLRTWVANIPTGVAVDAASLHRQLQAGILQYQQSLDRVQQHIQQDGQFLQRLKDTCVSRLKEQYTLFQAELQQQIPFATDLSIKESAAAIARAVQPVFDAAAIEAATQRAINDFKERFNRIKGLPGNVKMLIKDVEGQLNGISERCRTDIEKAKAAITAALDQGGAPEAVRQKALGQVIMCRRQLDDTLRLVNAQVDELLQRYGNALPTVFTQALLNERKKVLIAIEQKFQSIEKSIRDNTSRWKTDLEAASTAFQQMASNVQQQISVELTRIERFVQPAFVQQVFDRYEAQVRQTLQPLLAAANTQAEAYRNALLQMPQVLDAASGELKTFLTNLTNHVKTEVDGVLANVLGTADQLGAYFKENLLDALQIPQWVDAWKDLERPELLKRLDMLSSEALGFSSKLLDFAKQIEPIRLQLPALPGNAQDMLQQGIKLVRAFGEPPKLPGLDFNRGVLEGVAYTFIDKDNLNKIANAVQLTKLTSFVQDPARQLRDAAQSLVPMKLDFPVNALKDRLEPMLDELKKMSVADIFKNLAGIPFDKMFPGIKLPDLAGKGINVSHELDYKSRTARVKADVNIPFEKGRAIPVFSLAGVTLTLRDALLHADIDILVEPQQPPRTRAQGDISGNWEIKVGGYAIAEIVNTTLRFDEKGRIHFNLSPGNIRLKQILQFITDFLAQLSTEEGGFSIRVTPAGVEAQLSIPVPDMQGAAFGIANLFVGLRLALQIINSEFVISTGLIAGRKSAPFTLTIFILGGAGWIETDVSYYPKSGEFDTRVSIGIMASASLAISLGPVSGGIFAYFGINVEYGGQEGRAGNLTIGVVIMFIGRVSLLRICQVSMGLILQAHYQQGGGLTGRGTVYYKIKIGWCFTIKVKASVQYRFGKAGGGRQQNLTTTESLLLATVAAAPATREERYEAAARLYLDMFEN